MFNGLNAADLTGNFALLDGWEERYGYVLDLGRQLPVFPDEARIEANFVKGCTAQVWMIPVAGAAGTVNFLADSDAHIVRGLIAILMVVYNGEAADAVRSFDIEGFFGGLGLSEHLSPNRRNGFFAMVGRIRALAEGKNA